MRNFPVILNDWKTKQIVQPDCDNLIYLQCLNFVCGVLRRKNHCPQKTDKLGFLKKIFCLQNLKKFFVCYCIAYKFFWGE